MNKSVFPFFATMAAFALTTVPLFSTLGVDVSLIDMSDRMQRTAERHNRGFRDQWGCTPTQGRQTVATNPRTAQLIQPLLAAIANDADPTILAQVDQAVAQTIGSSNAPYMQRNMLNLAEQLLLNPNDDVKRGGARVYFSTLVIMGADQEQFEAALASRVAAWDRSGMRWHRVGSFGRFLRQCGL